MRRGRGGRRSRLCGAAAFWRQGSSLGRFVLAILLSLVPAVRLTALPQDAEPGPTPGRQQTLLKEAFALLDGGKPEAARTPLEAARTLAREQGDIASEAEAARGLGLVLQAAKDLVGARARFDEALRLYESIHDLRGMGRTYSSLGMLAWTRGNWKEDQESYSRAADAFGEAGDPALQAQALRNMTFSLDMSDAEAIEILQRAWALVRPFGEARLQGLILHQWGDRLTNMGDYGAALEKLEAASPLIDRLGKPLEAAYLATSLGRAYRLHGLPEEALTYQKKALAISERSGDQRSIAQALRAVAVAYAALGRHAEALDFAARSLSFARGSGNPVTIAFAIGLLAAYQLEVGQYSKVIELAQSALLDKDHPAMREEEVFLRISLGRAYLGVGRLDDAVGEVDRAVSLAEALDQPATLAWALRYRALVRSRRHDAEGALLDSARGIALFERLRSTLARRDFFKQGFGDLSQEVFTLAIDVRAESGDAAGAWVVAEQARARAFQDLLATRQSAGASKETLGVLASDASVEAPTLEDLKAVVARLRSPLLAYWVGPRETFIWAVTPRGKVEVRRVDVDATTLEALARAASIGPASVATRGTGPAPAAEGPPASSTRSPALRQLYELLIKPVESVLQSETTTRVTVIPHGPLFRVSFASLVDARGRYLIERFELHYAPAVGVFRFTGKNVRGQGVKSALLVADPDLSQQTSSEKLAPLAGARLEVKDAALRFGAGSEILIGQQATEERVRSLVGGRDLLHFATHGIVSDRNPLGSYLALTSSGLEPGNDGRLTAAEIYRLDISADLVVLSACRSGAGKVTGDGIIGLTRGFFYAGAPSVLATLWDLADEPARFLMRRFYAHWQAGGSKASALRASQLDLIRALREGKVVVQTPFGPTRLSESPALWASFVLLGEP